MQANESSYVHLLQLSKKPEKKHNLITNFFKSPPSTKESRCSDSNNANEEQLDTTDKGNREYDEDENHQKKNDGENDMNDSLCDFETSSQVLPNAVPKEKAKRLKDKKKTKARTTKKSKRARTQSRGNNDESFDLPYEDFSSLNLSEASDVKNDEQNKAGEVDIKVTSDLSVAKEISYEDFLKFNSLGGVGGSDNVENKKATEGIVQNVVEQEQTDVQNLKEETARQNSSENYGDECVVVHDNAGMSEEKLQEKRKKTGSYFTILPSRQLSQTNDGPKAPVVITVNVPDSPVSKPVKSFSIFDKTKAKTGFIQPANEAPKCEEVTQLEKEKDHLQEDINCKRKSKTRQKASTRAKASLRQNVVETEEDIENEEAAADVVENVSEQQQKVTAKKMACLDQVVIKSTAKATQSTLCFGQDGLTTMKSPPSSKTDLKECSAVKKDQLKRTNKNLKKKNASEETVKSKVKPAQVRRRKKQIMTSDSDDSEIEIINTPKRTKSRKRTDTEKSEDTETEGNTARRRRRSKRIYSAEIVQSPVPMKKAPIKLRLTRLALKIQITCIHLSTVLFKLEGKCKSFVFFCG